jgi:hypothetical protein
MEKCPHNIPYGTKYDKFNCAFCTKFPASTGPTGPIESNIKVQSCIGPTGPSLHICFG